MRRDHLTADAAGSAPRPRQHRRRAAARLRAGPCPHRGVSPPSRDTALPGDPRDAAAASCPASGPSWIRGRSVPTPFAARCRKVIPVRSARGVLPAVRRIHPLRLPLRADGAAGIRRAAVRATAPAGCRQRVPRRDAVRGDDLQRAHRRSHGPGSAHRGNRGQRVAGPSDGFSHSDRRARVRRQRQQVQQIHEPRRRAGGVVRRRSSAARSAGRSRERISPRPQRSRGISRAVGSPGASRSRRRSPTMCSSCWRKDQRDPHPGARCSILAR